MPSRAACIHCHARKVRCDARMRGIPCSNCEFAGKTDCKIHIKRRPTRPIRRQDTAAAPSSPTSTRSPRPAVTLTQVDPQIRISATPSTSPSSTNNSYQDHVSIPGLHIAGGQSIGHNEDHPDYKGHLAKFIRQEDAMLNRSIQRGVRITYVGTDISNLNFLVRQRNGQHGDAVFHFPTDQMSPKDITHEPERIPLDSFMLPEKELMDDLINSYFTLVHPGFPILDQDDFMSQYRSTDPNNMPSILILQAILLVGAHVSRPQPLRDRLKAVFFRRAKALFDARYEGNRDVVVQAALLLTWHSDGAEDVSANTWFWVGVAARTAIGLGMYRDASASTLVAAEKRIWRRTWWLLVQCDVLVSLSYGKPQAINLDECDIKPLTNEDFEGTGPAVQRDYVIRSTQLCTLISSIMRERFGYNTTPQGRKVALSKADEALANWSLLLPIELRLRPTGMDIWASTLHITYNNFLILLHRPHPRPSLSLDGPGPNDAEICSAAAGAITNIFENLREKDQIKLLWESATNALFTTMIQISVEMRLQNPLLAINALRRFDSTLYSLRQLAGYWINAETILRLFDESGGNKSPEAPQTEAEAELQLADPVRDNRHDSDEVPTIEKNVQLGNSIPPSCGDADVALTEGNTLPSDWANSSADNYQLGGPQEEALDEPYSWRQLFPFSDLHPPEGIPESDLEMIEEQWREMYWQELGIPSEFGSGAWG